jgi:hypothetical protein
MKKTLVFLCLLFSGCENKQTSYAKINLYPGYIAKSQGNVIWFPQEPKYDEINGWVGDNPVVVSSCIADPWPFSSGGTEFLIRVD